MISSSSPFHPRLPFATARIELHHPSLFPGLSPQLVCKSCMGGDLEGRAQTMEPRSWVVGRGPNPREQSYLKVWDQEEPEPCAREAVGGSQLGVRDAWVVTENQGCFKRTRQVQKCLLSSFVSTACYLPLDVNNKNKQREEGISQPLHLAPASHPRALSLLSWRPGLSWCPGLSQGRGPSWGQGLI